MSNIKKVFSYADLDVKKGVELISKAFEDKLNIIENENREICEILKSKDYKIEELQFVIERLGREYNIVYNENIELKKEILNFKLVIKELKIENEKLLNFRNSVGTSLANDDVSYKLNSPFVSQLSENMSNLDSPNFSYLMKSPARRASRPRCARGLRWAWRSPAPLQFRLAACCD